MTSLFAIDSADDDVDCCCGDCDDNGASDDGFCFIQRLCIEN